MKIQRIHFFSGIVLFVFTLFHLANHLYALSGVEAHIRLMENFRIVYRHPIAETMLFIAVAMQVISGLSLYWKVRKVKDVFFVKYRYLSGAYLAFFFVIHLSAVMAGRFFLKIDTNIYFGAAGLNSFPAFLFFVPYYSLAIISFFVHMACIHALKMKKSILGFRPNQQAYGIIALGLLCSILVLYAMTDGGNGLDIPVPYKM